MLRVVIADDSALLRERVEALISDLADVQLVGQATNAQEALEVVQRSKPDVVVLDIRMPGGNGIEALKMIRALEAPPVVIMLTAFPYPQYRTKCIEAGAAFFLDKAKEFDRVADVLEQMRASTVGDLPTGPAAGLPQGEVLT